MTEPAKQSSEALLEAVANEIATLQEVSAPTTYTASDWFHLLLLVVLCVVYYFFKKGLSIKDIYTSVQTFRSTASLKYESLKTNDGKLSGNKVIAAISEAKLTQDVSNSVQSINVGAITNTVLTTFKISKFAFIVLVVAMIVILIMAASNYLRF